MTVPVLFALVGLIILVGFLANLLFRITKIPSVLVLIAIGVVLGPVTGWIQHDSLLSIAPYFGAVALLVILFEGGLELEIDHVVRHAPRTAIFLNGVSYVGDLGYRALVDGWNRDGTYPATYVPTISRPGDPLNAGWTGRTGRVETIVVSALGDLHVDPLDQIGRRAGGRNRCAG